MLNSAATVLSTQEGTIRVVLSSKILLTKSNLFHLEHLTRFDGGGRLTRSKISEFTLTVLRTGNGILRLGAGRSRKNTKQPHSWSSLNVLASVIGPAAGWTGVQGT